MTNGDVLDRSYADFLEGSYSVIVKGLSVLMSGRLYDFFLLRPKNSGLQIGATNDVRPELGIDRTNPCRTSCPAFTDSFREISVFSYLIITRATLMFAIEKKTNIRIDNLVVEKFPPVANFHDVIESCRERKSSCLPLSLI